MTKVALKIERHYGNKDLKIIIESLISLKLSNIKYSNNSSGEVHCNTCNKTTSTIAIESPERRCE
ncbi:MAG: hypothetical protein N2B06_06950 [Clostridium sp.]